MIEQANQDQRAIIIAFQRDLPVRVGSLAQELGLGVVKSTLHPGISGQIEPNDQYRSGFLIRVNRHEVRERQRFTIAHEIGHFVLHSDKIGHGIIDTILYRSKLSSQLEVQANKFAAQLLMPFDRLRQEHARFGGGHDRTTIVKLSELFQVSVDAMEIRLGLR